MGTRAPVTEVDEPPARRGTGHCDVWLRRCASCRRDDLDAAFGQRALIPEDRWRCASCACPNWEPARVSFPAGPSGRCPYLDRR